MRGNRGAPVLFAARRGSTPARAGEPLISGLIFGLVMFYPRACGGTLPLLPLADHLAVLPPRVRGNRSCAAGAGEHTRSTPARAGEPEVPFSELDKRWFYPRACGGTMSSRRSNHRRPVLSPRVRGNRAGHRGSAPWKSSIPARAGEPTSAASPTRPSKFYPRACGGTVDTRARVRKINEHDTPTLQLLWKLSRDMDMIERIIFRINKKGKRIRTGRERYANFILPTLEDPDEIWLTWYSEPGEYRHRYLKLFRGEDKVLAFLAITRKDMDSSLFVTFFRCNLKYADRQRTGTLLYQRNRAR